MARINFREESRKIWIKHRSENESVTIDDLKFGAILRIADSLETIVKPHMQLLESINRLRAENRLLEDRNEKLRKQIATYRRIIRRMKAQEV